MCVLPVPGRSVGRDREPRQAGANHATRVHAQLDTAGGHRQSRDR